jgi:hypothetical protein
LKRTSLLILLFCISFFGNAQTNVSGFINANTTWTLAGSPYIVVGNALLTHGNTLTIDPGVVVKFDTGRVLQIDGELIAIGTAANRITFTSNRTNPAAGDWGKIHFADTCIDAVFDTGGNYVSGSIMKYCNIKYGGRLGYGIIHLEHSAPYFSHCRIENSAKSAIYCFGNSYVIDSSFIGNCLDYGLYFAQYNINLCGLVIRQDSIINNKGAIFWEASYDTCAKKIIGNYFINNTSNTTIYSDAVKNLTISENYFINNVASSNISFISGSNFFIDCNHFISNQTSLGVISASAVSSSISHNIFENNSSSTGTSVLNINLGAYLPTYIKHNIFKNNSSPNGSCCIFIPNWNFNTVSLHVENNTFNNNSGINTIKFNTLWSSSNSSYVSLYFKNNNLVNNTLYEINNNVPYGSQNIFADSNYWGTTNTQTIDSAIYDYFDYGNLSVVYYQPILTAPAEVDTTCPPPITTSIQSSIIDNQFNIFPNPFTTTSTLSFATSIRNATLTIYNIYGQIMQRQDGISGKEITIDRKNLEAGIYVYEVTQGGRRVCAGKAVVY